MGVLNDATPVMCDIVVVLVDTICLVTCCYTEAPTVASGAWSWVTAKFYKPAGQQEEGAPDEQLTKQEAEPYMQEEKAHTGVYGTVCVCAM